VIGYSLPETDLLARALLAEVVRTRAARKKSTIKELHIADPNETVQNKLISLFNPALGPHGKIFRYNSIEEFDKRNFGTEYTVT
jgi:hypothetical protein